MPAMISHYMIGYDVLEQRDIPSAVDRDLFLLGTQGPDIFYFSRAYPWLPGKKGMPIGNALHEVQPSLLVDAFRAAIDKVAPDDRFLAESYVLGFLCHYAADRTVHPFVCAMQDRMIADDPTYAKDRNPYHYRIESALDTLLLRQKRGQAVERFSLTWLIPTLNAHADAVIAQVMFHVIEEVLHQSVSMRSLLKLRRDMRHSMWWMTDRYGCKHKAFCTLETVLHKDAWYSSLIRTPRVDWYDFANTAHLEWGDGDTADVFELYDRSIALTLKLMRLWREGANGWTMTQNMDFSGRDYIKKEFE